MNNQIIDIEYFNTLLLDFLSFIIFLFFCVNYARNLMIFRRTQLE